METNKLVSIGMPVYNGEAHIRRALSALKAQTYPRIEIIVSDDCSIDRTPQIVSELAENDSRIRLVRQPENLGLVKNFAYVLAESAGEYFMWAAQDDWWHPEFVEKLLAALEAHPEYGVAMSHFKVFRSSPEALAETPGGEHFFTDKDHAWVFGKMLGGKSNPIFEYGLWRRATLLGIFSRAKPQAVEDTKIFMCEAALATRFYSVPEMLYAKYRNPAPLLERHRYLGVYAAKPLAFTRSMGMILWWLMTSPAIPWRRKRLIISPWLFYVWRKKRKIWNLK